MAKIINIETGEMRESDTIPSPDPECNICKVEFSLLDDGGTAGHFGMIQVFFCPFCLSSMCDMVKQLIYKKYKDEE